MLIWRLHCVGSHADTPSHILQVVLTRNWSVWALPRVKFLVRPLGSTVLDSTVTLRMYPGAWSSFTVYGGVTSSTWESFTWKLTVKVYIYKFSYYCICDCTQDLLRHKPVSLLHRSIFWQALLASGTCFTFYFFSFLIFLIIGWHPYFTTNVNHHALRKRDQKEWNSPQWPCFWHTPLDRIHGATSKRSSPCS
jgi:hypothetical protein